MVVEVKTEEDEISKRMKELYQIANVLRAFEEKEKK